MSTHRSTSVSTTKQLVRVFFWSRPFGPEGHPDPDGFHLAIVCHIVRKCLSTEIRRGSWDVGLFWDFGSLYQNPRDPDQDDLYKKGLAASNIWFASAESYVWTAP